MNTQSSETGLSSDKKEVKPFSILVVDDEEYVLAFIEIKLKVSGYKVLTAGDGIQALEIIKNSSPDLVIIDLIMPRVDGPTLLKEIRQFSTVPVIILSAIDPQDAIVRELLASTNDYILKPFSPDELVARIEAIRKRQHDPGTAV